MRDGHIGPSYVKEWVTEMCPHSNKMCEVPKAGSNACLRLIIVFNYSVIRWILILSIHVFISLTKAFCSQLMGSRGGRELISRYLQMAVEKKKLNIIF